MLTFGSVLCFSFWNFTWLNKSFGNSFFWLEACFPSFPALQYQIQYLFSFAPSILKDLLVLGRLTEQFHGKGRFHFLCSTAPNLLINSANPAQFYQKLSLASRFFDSFISHPITIYQYLNDCRCDFQCSFYLFIQTLSSSFYVRAFRSSFLEIISSCCIYSQKYLQSTS